MPSFGSNAWDPVWSADGERVLFASDRDGRVELFSADITGRDFRQETDTAGVFGDEMRLRGRSDWSPTNVIATYIGSDWNWEILMIDGDGMRQITDGGNNLAPSFSPDGQWIAFTSYRDNYGDENGCEIYIMRRDGSDVRRLTYNEFCDWQPRWGP
jgi:TolB protein